MLKDWCFIIFTCVYKDLFVTFFLRHFATQTLLQSHCTSSEELKNTTNGFIAIVWQQILSSNPLVDKAQHQSIYCLMCCVDLISQTELVTIKFFLQLELSIVVFSSLSILKCMDQRHLSCSDHSHQVETPTTPHHRLVVFLTHWRKCFLNCRRVVTHRNVQTHGHRLRTKRCQFCSTSMDHEEKNYWLQHYSCRSHACY